uniref:Protein cps3 n=1 Tax=Anthurium amnicola TaxID=1678845 RepID=A0A1D1YIN2_9ARAE
MASSLPNPPSILAQLYPRQLDNNNFLSIPSIVTSPSIPSSVSESFLFNYQQEQLNSPISQAISAPVTPTSSVTPGFSQPPRRGKGNQNQNGSNSSNDGKSNGSKSNSNLAHIPCKFFKSGACTAGKNCVFSHSKDPPSDNYVCKYFLKGNCKFGSKCALSHTLPNERKLSSSGRNGNKNANGSRNSISIPEIRSPIMLPQGYGQDLNDFQPLNSPGIPPFARIPVGSEYANNRPFSQLTASLNDPSAYSDENHTAPRLRNINTNLSNDHLSAPININGQQRRSLPDIFHLGGPMNNNSNNNNNNINVFSMIDNDQQRVRFEKYREASLKRNQLKQELQRRHQLCAEKERLCRERTEKQTALKKAEECNALRKFYELKSAQLKRSNSSTTNCSNSSSSSSSKSSNCSISSSFSSSKKSLPSRSMSSTIKQFQAAYKIHSFIKHHIEKRRTQKIISCLIKLRSIQNQVTLLKSIKLRGNLTFNNNNKDEVLPISANNKAYLIYKESIIKILNQLNNEFTDELYLVRERKQLINNTVNNILKELDNMRILQYKNFIEDIENKDDFVIINK